MTVLSFAERRLELLRRQVAGARGFDQVRALVLGAPEVLVSVLGRMGLPQLPPEGSSLQAELQFGDDRRALEFSWHKGSQGARNLVCVDCHGGYCRPGRWSVDALYAAHITGRAPGEVLPGAYWVSQMAWALRLVPAYMRGWRRWLEDVQWLTSREVFRRVTEAYRPQYVEALLSCLLGQAILTAYTNPGSPAVRYCRHQLLPGSVWDGSGGVEMCEPLRKMLKALNVAGIAACPGHIPDAGPDEPVILLRPVPVVDVGDCEHRLADALSARSRRPAGGAS
ncbi:MAG: hypothetical protein NUV99_03410 [Clostridia bacterium]|jgi:hypothetical protein|nr:hypothetical protein [Clostridia bacterium]